MTAGWHPDGTRTRRKVPMVTDSGIRYIILLPNVSRDILIIEKKLWLVPHSRTIDNSTHPLNKDDEGVVACCKNGYLVHLWWFKQAWSTSEEPADHWDLPIYSRNTDHELGIPRPRLTQYHSLEWNEASYYRAFYRKSDGSAAAGSCTHCVLWLERRCSWATERNAVVWQGCLVQRWVQHATNVTSP